MPTATERLTRLTARAESTEAPALLGNALLAATLAVATSVGLCMAVALIGWFFADSGAHGNTIDALRAGSLAWALGFGGSASTSIGHVGLTPLGLTGIQVVAVMRSARWGWRRAEWGEQAPTNRTLGIAWGAFVACFVVIAVILVEVASSATLAPSVTETFAGALVIAAVSSAWGGLAESGRFGELWAQVPATVRSIVRVAIQATLALTAVAAVLVGISLAMSFSDAGDMYTALKLSFGDALMLTVLCALALPNAVGLAIAYLSGPGFAVGTGTSVTVTSVSLGAIPLFPPLAALPDPGAQPGWLVALLFIPGLCALVAATRVQRRIDDDAGHGWDQVLLRGLGGGAAAGLVVTIFAVVSGGSLGDHRMAEIGPALWPVLVCAVGGMALGGALGGAVGEAWQRWRG